MHPFRPVLLRMRCSWHLVKHQIVARSIAFLYQLLNKSSYMADENVCFNLSDVDPQLQIRDSGISVVEPGFLKCVRIQADEIRRQNAQLRENMRISETKVISGETAHRRAHQRRMLPVRQGAE
ncbi:hypothetical protein D3C78_1186350 [compost metagenome]